MRRYSFSKTIVYRKTGRLNDIKRGKVTTPIALMTLPASSLIEALNGMNCCPLMICKSGKISLT